MKFALQNIRTSARDRVIISFFFNIRGTSLENSTTSIYRSLLLQLLRRQPELQDILGHFALKDRNMSSGYIWDVKTLKALFENTIRSIRSIYFIDALNECVESQARDMVAFFQQLGQSTVLSGLQFHVLFSSRHYPHPTIEKGLTLILKEHYKHSANIAIYVNAVLRISKGKSQEIIQDKLLAKASGVFL